MSDPLTTFEPRDPLSLEADPRNPRKPLPRHKRDKLRRIIEENGYCGGAVLRAETGLLLGGHQRLTVIREMLLSGDYSPEQLRSMNLTPDTFVVAVKRGLSDQQAWALMVALNNDEAMGEWDRSKLTAGLSWLDASGFDATLTAFDDLALSAMLTAVPTAPGVTDRQGAVDPFAGVQGVDQKRSDRRVSIRVLPAQLAAIEPTLKAWAAEGLLTYTVR